MRTATVRVFRDQATKLFKETEPILVTRRGRVVGFYLPATGTSLPLEIKKDLFHVLTGAIQHMMKTRGVREEAVLADFEKTRTARRRRYSDPGIHLGIPAPPYLPVDLEAREE